MARNVPGAKFVSKGIEYVLDYGSKGNLRPYTLGPIKKAAKTCNPYIIIATVVLVTTCVVGFFVWKKYKTNKIQMES